jgi:[acyl-carrier-protein] S-malonyltransferase
VRWVALFSGQGGQHAATLPRLPGALRDAWRRAIAAAGANPDDLDDAALARNRIAQPTIVAAALASFASVPADVPPVLVAGYSVGELAACAAAGGMSAVEAVAAAAMRAQAMDEAAPAAGGLVAVLGLTERALAPLCARLHVAIAIRNGPAHFVVGGAEGGLAQLMRDALAAGATRACRLPVHTPAHTPMLAAAVPRFADALRPLVRDLAVPSLAGIDGSRVRAASEAVDALSRQLATAIDWSSCMDVVAEARPDAVLEVGPGKALARMFADAHAGIPVRALSEFRQAAAAAGWLAKQHRR